MTNLTVFFPLTCKMNKVVDYGKDRVSIMFSHVFINDNEGPRAVLTIRWPGRRIAEDLLPFFVLFVLRWIDSGGVIAEMGNKETDQQKEGDRPPRRVSEVRSKYPRPNCVLGMNLQSRAMKQDWISMTGDARTKKTPKTTQYVTHFFLLLHHIDLPSTTTHPPSIK